LTSADSVSEVSNLEDMNASLYLKSARNDEAVPELWFTSMVYF